MMGWQGRMRRMTRMMLGQPLKDEGFDLGFPRYMYIYICIYIYDIYPGRNLGSMVT